MKKYLTFPNIMLAAGLLFLYVPIFSMIVYSFNNSRLVTVWDAANSPTLKWYGALFQDRQMLQAAWLSIRVAAMSATGRGGAGHAGGPGAGALRAFPRPRAAAGPDHRAAGDARGHHRPVDAAAVRVAWSSCFKALFGWQFDRGILTITLAHITFTMAYVTVVVQSRLAGFDDSLEEAALDLGARPAKVFFRITLPLITPAILSGWLLAFTLSWDDVVVSQFVAGPGSNTLPMVVLFGKVRLGVNPSVNALATLMVLIVATGVVVSAILMKRAEKTPRTRDAHGRAGAASLRSSAMARGMSRWGWMSAARRSSTRRWISAPASC